MTRIMNSMTNSYNNLPVRGGLFTRIKKHLVGLSVIALALSVFTGCEEDPSTIGGGILPGVDFTNLVSTDTLSVNMYTLYVDTIRSNMPSVTYFGEIWDPVFGSTTSEVVSQLWLYETWPGNGILSIDSVKIFLNISAPIGIESGEGIINIYETEEYLNEDSVYYVNRDTHIKSLLASIPVSGMTGDSLITFMAPISVGEVLTRDTTKLFLSNDSADIRTLITGVAFQYVPTGDKHMFKIDLMSGYTSFEVFYTTAANSSDSYVFTTNSKCVRYNTFIHDFESADADKKINHINDYYRDTLSYIQSYGGVYTRVEIPGLEALKAEMPLGINMAKMMLPAFLNDIYFPEENLVAMKVLARFTNSDGDMEIIPDYMLSENFFDGAYYSLDTEFRINIVNFIQLYLEGEIPEPAFDLFISSEYEANLILRSNNPDKPVRLEMVYTSLK